VPHPDFARVEFIYFDLDHTLWDHDSAETRAIERLAQLRGWPVASFRDAYRRHNEWCWREMAAGRMVQADARRLRFELAFEEVGLGAHGLCHEEAGRAYQDLYLGANSPMHGASEAVHALAKRFRLGILSNGFSDTQFKKLAHLGFADAFESVILSDHVGQMKPHAAIFEEAERRAGVPAESIAMVGDNPHADIDGAAARGWKTVWYPIPHGSNPLDEIRREPTVVPTAVVHDLMDLAGLFL